MNRASSISQKEAVKAVKKAVPRAGFIGDIIAELKKVVWLSRREAFYLTGIVLLVIIIVGIFLGLIDFGFGRLVNSIIIGG